MSYLNTIYNSKGFDGFKRTCLPHPKELELPFYISTFGITDREKSVDLRGLSKCYLVYSHKGCGRVFIDGCWEEVPEGSLIYFPSQSNVRYEPISGIPWTTAWITFSGKFAESILPQKAFVIGGDHSYIYDTVNSLREKYEEEDFYEHGNSKLYFILLKLRRLTENARSLKAYVNDTKGEFSKSLKYMIEHFTEDISISQLSEICGVSEEYYCRLFKKLEGTTPVSYINSLRITRACDMLSKEPERRIEDIAKDCGFFNISYFNRVFKKETGVSPGAFRKKNKA